MAWSTIRKASGEDNERLEAAARRFAKRHGIDVLDDSAVQAVECHLSATDVQFPEDLVKLGRLWRRAVQRDLNDDRATGIAYGHVGCSVE